MFHKLSKKLGLITFSSNASLKDGTSIIIDGNIEKGVKVFIQTEDGEQPLPDGEYTIIDPHSLIITVENGQITKITEIEEKEEIEEIQEEEETEKEETENNSVDEKLTELEDRIQKLEEIVNSLMSSNKELKKENKELKTFNTELKNSNVNFSKELNSLNELFEKIDGDKPLKKNDSGDYKLSLSEITRKRMNLLGYK